MTSKPVVQHGVVGDTNISKMDVNMVSACVFCVTERINHLYNILVFVQDRFWISKAIYLKHTGHGHLLFEE